MRWSKLKQRIEERFAESLRGRLEVQVTRYRTSHDQLYEFWMTYDKTTIFACSDGQAYATYKSNSSKVVFSVLGWSKIGKWEHLPANELYRESERNVYFAKDVVIELLESLSMSFDEMLNYGNFVIRALAMADARFGKRRLLAIEFEGCSPLEISICDIRCKLEGIRRPAALQLTTPFAGTPPGG